MSSIRQCGNLDLTDIYSVINDGARKYKGVIPADRWSEPYMTIEKLEAEIAAGIAFRGYELEGKLLGVMGVQFLGEVALIRHAYVRCGMQGRGIGSALLSDLLKSISGPCLIGTWASAIWAIGFYQKHGFSLVSHNEKEILLRKHWNIPERQIETSVVLANQDYYS